MSLKEEEIMVETIIIAIITCISLILSIIVFPKIKLFNKEISTYWLVGLFGAILMLIFNCIDIKEVLSGLLKDSSINPIKILILFISMTYLSVFLDEVGFFKFLATYATKKAKSNQIVLFFVIYTIVSVLTVFTSNDIVILTFTPFICYFAKNTKINPIPYLVAEFVGANTWSMMLIIGNPTNIFLATSAGIDFIEYFKIMFIPTILSGITEVLILYVLFHKQLKQPLTLDIEETKISDKPSVIIGLIHLLICLVLLVISSYINIPMWIICLCCVISLVLVISVKCLVTKTKFNNIYQAFKRLPFELIPFVISMFVIVLSLQKHQVTEYFYQMLGDKGIIEKYGIASFLFSNLINNIPMSVLFSTIPHFENINQTTMAIYSTIIGSNLGAFLTPIGALAGIMFTDLLSKQNVKYNFKTFTKYGFLISVPTVIVALFGLSLIL